MIKLFFHSIIILSAALALTTGCESDDKSLDKGKDFGDNNPELVLAMGDSITAGGDSGGAPWPSRFSSITGKTTINSGTQGATSLVGASRIGGQLSKLKPGYVVIFYGANDVRQGVQPSDTEAAIRSMVIAAKANKTVPLVVNVMPMSEGSSIFNPAIDALNILIKAAANSEGATFVNMNAAAGSDPGQYLVDGLHLNDAGETLVAMTIADRF